MLRRAALPVLALVLCARSAWAEPEPARPADAFVDSLGVNVHLSFDGTPYVDGFDSVIVPRLAELGVRHVRDGAQTGPTANADLPFYGRVRALAAQGIRFSFITAMDTSFGQATDLTQLDDVYAWSDQAVDAFEGINEPDLQTIPGHPEADAWVQITRDAQAALYQAVRGNPALASVQVLGPSITSLNGALDKPGDLGASVDLGNGHPYPGGFCPACGTFYGQSVDTWAPAEAALFGAKPMVMTETGYHDAVQTTGGHRPASERAAGKYLPRLFLEFFNRNIVRTYSYEFVDSRVNDDLTDPEAHFGLLRRDGTPKPAFTAERSLIALLSDPGPVFSPTPLDVSLVDAPAEVHHTLLQKRDGRYYLALWQEVASYDTGWRADPPADGPALRGDLTVAPVEITVHFARSFDLAVVHAWNDEGTVTRTQVAPGGMQVTVPVGDALTILELGNAPSDVVDGGGSGSSSGDPGTPDASSDAAVAVAEADSSDSGCGCRTAPTSAAPGAGVLLLAALLRRRRVTSAST